MTTEHRSFPPIENTTTFDARQAGPLIVPLMLMAALSPSTDYPRSRITLCSVIGAVSLTAHQAAQLRDQLEAAISAVVAACPEMSVPDDQPVPVEIARG